MKRLTASLASAAAALSALALLDAPPAAAAQNSAMASIPIDPITTLEIHTTANCVPGDQCYFTSSANLLTPDGPTGFPPQFYARQNTTLRSNSRDVYLEADFNAPNTREFKSITDVEFSTVYFDGGPPQKFTLPGNVRTLDWATGQPDTSATLYVCSYIQVVYANVNLTSPTACAATTY